MAVADLRAIASCSNTANVSFYHWQSFFFLYICSIKTKHKFVNLWNCMGLLGGWIIDELIR